MSKRKKTNNLINFSVSLKPLDDDLLKLLQAELQRRLNVNKVSRASAIAIAVDAALKYYKLCDEKESGSNAA